jgi:hypothetical protein
MEQSRSWQANSSSANQEICTLYGTRTFIATFTRAGHLSPVHSELVRIRLNELWLLTSKQLMVVQCGCMSESENYVKLTCRCLAVHRVKSSRSCGCLPAGVVNTFIEFWKNFQVNYILFVKLTRSCVFIFLSRNILLGNWHAVLISRMQVLRVAFTDCLCIVSIVYRVCLNVTR